MDSAMRGSRRRFAGQRRPTALLMTSVSPSSVYQMTAWRGAPSSSVVAIVAKRSASRNRRTASEIGVVVRGSVEVMAAMVRGGRSAVRQAAHGGTALDLEAAAG